MRSWQLQEARSRVADVLDAAAAEPQRITRRGERAVVVVSEDEWTRLSGEKQNFGSLLMRCPITADDLPHRRPARVLLSGAFDS